jgi:hypothetical protein
MFYQKERNIKTLPEKTEDLEKISFKSSIHDQAFSNQYFHTVTKQYEVIDMNLKGWPFQPLGKVTPCGEGNGAGPGTPK